MDSLFAIYIINNFMVFEWCKSRGFEGHLFYIDPFPSVFMKQFGLITL